MTEVVASSHSFVRTPEVPEAGSNPQPRGGDELSAFWDGACILLQKEKSISSALHDQLCSDARLLRIESGVAELLVSDRLNAVLNEDHQRLIQAKLGVAARRPLRLRIVTGHAPPPNITNPYKQDHQRMLTGSIFNVPGSGMTNTQLWAAVQQSLNAGGDIPKAELAMWSGASELLALVDSTFVLGFGNAFLCRRAEHRLADLEREFTYLAGFSCEIEIVETSIWQAEQKEHGA